ncbi:SM-20-related protein [Roseivirga ehrenbergii]|uniref:2OG-Fe(II) oxygenase n=1 Tax=Roseivirga ehrenbergii (strain DSM 102268 / JCM 13514 / KCTC 12282 / NCIMB 14502 / KMM 6017) TaxID=279360 RepID=A0A150XE73_ROSEK|nr:2OG-Fe(II) oxygenase [Roseivirga ehrenbergii]KYG77000.1 2OG-Fe(II) oxygenase [Roseivirga ehrenbergii]TCL14500.1 SM-20-related protein [Roseivirga ehrenbergii]
MTKFSEEQWIDWVDQLSQNDFVVIDDFLDKQLFENIRTYFIDRLEMDGFSDAAIGALNHKQLEKSIRGDKIYWLERKNDIEMESFFQLSDELIQQLNQLCYLSLSGCEFHLAHYPIGTFYKKHIDQFKGRSNRLISVIIYLNVGWKPGDGGELKVFKENGDELLVEPLAGRCVMFKSDTVPHEVMKTQVNRYSLTGWLLYQPSTLGYLLG